MSDIISIKNLIEDVLGDLKDVEGDLRSARNWGIYDMIGGKSISSFIKHSKINKAEKKFNNLSKKLSLLQSKLNSSNIDFDGNFNTGGLNQFLDVFMDNVFSDLFTQSKISYSLDKVKKLKYSLEDLLNRL